LRVSAQMYNLDKQKTVPRRKTLVPIMTDYNIFYSWQSDLDDRFEMDQIRFIENAINKIKTSDKIGDKTFLIDKATRDTSGAINIIESIDSKIKQCDIFIADISIINKGSKKFRKTPNPNVMYELGLAVESVGWNSIIFVMNEHFGSFDDLPFDIKTRRAITFNLPVGQKSDKSVSKTLSEQIVGAIITCADKDPKLRLKEISNALKDSEWEVYNFTNGNTDTSEIKGIVRIKQLFRHIYSFDFDSYETQNRFMLGDWKARFFVNESNLTTAELAFRSGVDFGFKTIMFPLDRKYDELFLIGEKPDYGNQVLKRKK